MQAEANQFRGLVGDGFRLGQDPADPLTPRPFANSPLPLAPDVRNRGRILQHGVAQEEITGKAKPSSKRPENWPTDLDSGPDDISLENLCFYESFQTIHYQPFNIGASARTRECELGKQGGRGWVWMGGESRTGEGAGAKRGLQRKTG